MSDVKNILKMRVDSDADLELAQRSASGSLLHFILLLVVAFCTPYFHDRPLLIWIVGSILLVVGVARLWLAKSFASKHLQSPVFWRTCFRVGALAAAVTWGIFCCLTVAVYSPQWIAWLLLLMTTGVAAGASVSLSPDFKLFVSYALILLGPTIAWGLIGGAAQGRPISVVVALYVAFLLVQGREQSHAYWRARTASALLESKTSELEERNSYFRALIEGSPLAIVVLDTEHRIQICNQAFERLFLFRQQECIGKNLDELLKTEELASEMEEFTRMAEAGNRVHAATRRRKKDGVWIDVELHAVPLILGNKLVGLYGFYQDITERKTAENKLEEANQKLADWVEVLERQSTEISALSEMGNWLQSCQTAEEAHTVISNSVQKLFPEYAGALCIISASRNLLDTVITWKKPTLPERVFAPGDCWALRRGQPYRFEAGGRTPICRHAGEQNLSETFCLPLMAQGEALGILYLEAAQSVDEDNFLVPRLSAPSEQRLGSVLAEQIGLALANLRLRETLRHQSVRDPLTGLYNRRYMEESFEREMSRASRNNNSVALLMIDIDHFKKFNDTFGHQAGDALLRGFGELLKNRTRGQDIACRYGGEEFAIVLSDSGLDAAIARAELLREEVKQLNVQNAGQLLGNISLSIGVALYPQHGSTIAELIRVADEALYRAKHEGRDRVMVAGVASSVRS